MDSYRDGTAQDLFKCLPSNCEINATSRCCILKNGSYKTLTRQCNMNKGTIEITYKFCHLYCSLVSDLFDSITVNKSALGLSSQLPSHKNGEIDGTSRGCILPIPSHNLLNPTSIYFLLLVRAKTRKVGIEDVCACISRCIKRCFIYRPLLCVGF